MPECSSIDPLVTPYVDDALAPVDRELVEQHLHSCPQCGSRVAVERSVRELLVDRRALLQEDRAPTALRIRCAAAGSRVAGRDRAAWSRRAAPLALAATLVLALGGVALYRATQASTRVMAAELVADHMKCFILNAMLGLGRSQMEQAEVERSLASGFGWNAHLPDRPAEADLELLGVRPCLYGAGVVAHVMYRHHGQLVSVFMLPEKQRIDELIDVLGHEAAVWSTDDRTFVLVARESPDEVQRIASFVHASMR